VVAEIGVHDDDKVAGRDLQSVDVGGAEAELAGAGLEDNMRCVGLDELVGDLLRAVGGAVVDDDELPVKLAIEEKVSVSALCHCHGCGDSRYMGVETLTIPLCEGAI
jgi:hypothetical protein